MKEKFEKEMKQIENPKLEERNSREGSVQPRAVSAHGGEGFSGKWTPHVSSRNPSPMQLVSIYPMYWTPLWIHKPAKELLNIDKLATFILDIEKTQETIDKSNVGGWQSQGDFLKIKKPIVKALKKAITIQVTEYLVKLGESTGAPTLNGQSPPLYFTLEAWANINRKGHWNMIHNHPESDFSGVLYVEADNQETTGEIVFVDPRFRCSVLIPSFLHHVRLFQLTSIFCDFTSEGLSISTGGLRTH